MQHQVSIFQLLKTLIDRGVPEDLVVDWIVANWPMKHDISFRDFAAKVAPHYQWYKHCEVLGNVLQRVADGELSRVMIFMPPRHGKSELTSRLFSAYYLHRYPERWVGLCSYTAELAHGLSRNAKDYYCEAGHSLKLGARAAKHWETGAGGGMWAAGVAGSI